MRHVREMQTFLTLLYQDAQDGWLVLSHPDPAQRTPQGKPAWLSDWFDVKHATFQSIACAAAQHTTTYNLYFGVALQHPACIPSVYRRGREVNAYIVPGLWFDLDLAYGQHAASALPAGDADALNFLHRLPLRPNLIVHSGGGLYGYWLFKEPYVIANDTEHQAIVHLSRRFTQTLVTIGAQHGWTLDAVGDAARVLRPPGSINHKYGTWVEVMHHGDERYDPGDFAPWLIDLPRPSKSAHQGNTIAGQLDLVSIAQHYGAVLTDKSRTELAGPHPTHGSSTGNNFNINPDKGVWHCWRHDTGGDALTLIAMCEGWLTCEQVRRGALTGELFKRTVTVANRTFNTRIVLKARERDRRGGRKLL